MSRGPGRWQRELLTALDAVPELSPLVVADVGLQSIDRSMTPSEYRALNRAAWLLQQAGRAHLSKLTGRDYRNVRAQRLVIYRCANCSHVTGREHLAAAPCLNCGALTELRNVFRPERPYCGCRGQGAPRLARERGDEG